MKSVLDRAKRGHRFSVEWRLYHGWHRGKTPTEEHRVLSALRDAALRPDNSSEATAAGGTMQNVVFDPYFEFGNELLCGGNASLLYDTLRP